MNELSKFGDKLLEYLNSTEVFLRAQAPDFVNQFVAYETWKVGWQFYFWLFAFLLLIGFQVINFMCYYHRDREGYQDNSGYAFFAFVIGACGVASLAIMLDYYAATKKLELAPKVYMVEQAKRMIWEKECRK